MGGPVTLILAGGCAVWALPGDGTCAGFARRVVRQVAGGLGMPDGLAYDLAVAVSEIATNAFVHAGPQEAGPAEMWIYVRRARSELVVKVFDTAPWRGPIRYGPLRPGTESEGGRGFEVVDALAVEHGGAWGMHRTRSRLGASAPGKAVFVSVPVSGVVSTESRPVRQVAWELYALLEARGVGEVRCSLGHGMAVICVQAAVNVWVGERGISYCVPGGGVARHALCDGIEVVERVVRHCADLGAGG
ncbi:ATP-binding protein [Actinomadura xylanilytica]|uniref:ATP-binding protein n=1 Tax=Actinomadura xylanilytica TaxID=887459 RepID=UPI00255B0383|nr:ATP-binding protein [Actinomadura xylanilytica]MDL4772597.1 ATP-binding protein [Actinomadura xylanilytica]